ncbi:hypothetical protein M408DRAFT_228033 [Serendipita vermifera MAFF 305830]|uniref:Uncharacterized protein n=1 Tax=Serendipita vermifera MAFF 305830 TaxID=933852 RepID=A0A0C3AJU2_SERVB|nr:hypothetical protein M408DRAFT_228033 [Serendipita vermifera MAFF 305830]
MMKLSPHFCGSSLDSSGFQRIKHDHLECTMTNVTLLFTRDCLRGGYIAARRRRRGVPPIGSFASVGVRFERIIFYMRRCTAFGAGHRHCQRPLAG